MGNSLSLKLGSDMAWHIQNNGVECQMQTKNAWSPLKPDDYHMCKFTLDVYDLDEYRRETRYYRTIGCYGPGWRRSCQYQWRAYTALTTPTRRPTTTYASRLSTRPA